MDVKEAMATHSSSLAWRIPGTGEPGGLPSMGSHRVRHDWSDLAATAAMYGCESWTIKKAEVKCSESHSVMTNSLWPCGLYSPQNSPGQNTGVGNRSLLQQIFPTQGLNLGLLHCRQILYQLSHKGSPKTLKNWCFCTVVLEKTLKGPLDCKEIKTHYPGKQPSTIIGRTDAEAETPILWPLDAKNWLMWKDPVAGKDWLRLQEEKAAPNDGWIASLTHIWVSATLIMIQY